MKKTFLLSIATLVVAVLSLGSCNPTNTPENPDDKKPPIDTTGQGGGGSDIEIPKFKNAKWTELHQTMVDKGWELKTFMPEPNWEYNVSKIEWKASDDWAHGWILVYSPDSDFLKRYFTLLMQSTKEGWKEFDKMVDKDGNKVDAFSNEKDYIVTYVDENAANTVIGVYWYGDVKQ